METHQRLADAKMCKKRSGAARILGDHSVAKTQGIDSPKRQVTEIPDRGGDQCQRRKNLVCRGLQFFSLLGFTILPKPC